jgi:hypothetical protein
MKQLSRAIVAILAISLYWFCALDAVIPPPVARILLSLTLAFTLLSHAGRDQMLMLCKRYCPRSPKKQVSR